MSTTYKEVEKEFNQAHDEAYRYWSTWLLEAQRDIKFFLSDQWSTQDKEYLDSQNRNALVFNKVHRIIKMLTGRQRRDRLSLKVDPIESSDERTASQLTAVLLWVLQYCNGYNVISDSFEGGSLQSGINLINIWRDRSEDPISGDLRLTRIPYNKFLLDPSFTERDLSDCKYLLRREWLSKESVQALLPNRAGAIKKMNPVGIDGKFSFFTPPKDIRGEDLMTYDEFWVKIYKNVKVIVDPKTLRQREWKASNAEMKRYLDTLNPQTGNKYGSEVRVVNKVAHKVEQRVLVNGHCMYKGNDDLGIDDYPYVPVIGHWTPEYEKVAWKLKGVVRDLRDPQEELNKRHSKVLDMLDGVIANGLYAEEETFVKQQSAYQTGQGRVLWLKKGALTEQKVKEIPPPQIPEGLFRALENMDKAIEEIPGGNAELFGTPETKADIAGMLAKMRVGQGLTIFQDLFDNLAFSQKILGSKLVKAIQKCYTPEKIMRILGPDEKVSEEFFNRDFGKYDAVPVEGLLSDTQKQMSFMQLYLLKQLGLPIPDKSLIDAVNVENKDKLIQTMEEQAKQQQKTVKSQEEMDQLVKAMTIAQTKSSIASVDAKTARAKEDIVDAELDRIKMLKEAQDINLDRVQQTLELIKMIEEPVEKDTGNNVSKR